MTQNEKARFNAYTLSLAHLVDNQAITKEVPAFEQTCLAAKQLLADIEATNSRRAEKLGGVTSKKQQHRDELASQALAIASVIRSYATDQQDPKLKLGMTFTFSELRFAGDTGLNEHCNNILARARELGTVLEAYGINEDKLKQFQLSLNQYTESKVQPRSQLAERKDAGKQVKEMMRMLNTLFVDKLDAMMLLFKTTHREFYGQYLAKRAIVSPGHRSTRIEGRIKAKAGDTELSRVKISIQGTNLSTISNEDGTYVIKSPVLPTVTVVYEREGYQTTTAEVSVKRGQATLQDIVMETSG